MPSCPLVRQYAGCCAHNFIHLDSVTVCRGAYPPALVAEWERWDQASATTGLGLLRTGPHGHNLSDSSDMHVSLTHHTVYCLVHLTLYNILLRGAYTPRHVLVLQENTSENDHPQIFIEEQLFVVFGFENGGEDLERFKFGAAKEAKSMLQQLCMSLAGTFRDERLLQSFTQHQHLSDMCACLPSTKPHGAWLCA